MKYKGRTLKCKGMDDMHKIGVLEVGAFGVNLNVKTKIECNYPSSNTFIILIPLLSSHRGFQ